VKIFRFVFILMSLSLSGQCASSNSIPVIQMCLKDMRFRKTSEMNSGIVCIQLQLTNLGSSAVCFLPSEAQASYILRYDNGEFDSCAWGNKTANTSAHNLSDIEIAVVNLQPSGGGQVLIQQNIDMPLKGESGTLRISLQCAPLFEDTLYRGVEVYRQKLCLTSRVKIKYEEKSLEWVVMPEAINVIDSGVKR